MTKKEWKRDRVREGWYLKKQHGASHGPSPQGCSNFTPADLMPSACLCMCVCVCVCVFHSFIRLFIIFRKNDPYFVKTCPLLSTNTVWYDERLLTNADWQNIVGTSDTWLRVGWGFALCPCRPPLDGQWNRFFRLCRCELRCVGPAVDDCVVMATRLWCWAKTCRLQTLDGGKSRK